MSHQLFNSEFEIRNAEFWGSANFFEKPPILCRGRVARPDVANPIVERDGKPVPYIKQPLFGRI